MTSIDWAREYRAGRERITELTSHLDEPALSTTVPACPAWTVHDTVAHVAGIAVALTTGDLPAGNTQEWIDGLVERRRSHPTSEVLAQWADTADGVDAFLANLGPNGGQMVYDVVAHEHDIRHAIGRPGARDSSGVLASAEAMSMLLRADLAKASMPAVRITSAGRTWDVGDGEPQIAIELDPFELIRVFGSRRSEAQMRALPWQGDIEPYLPALAHNPYPERDLVE